MKIIHKYKCLFLKKTHLYLNVLTLMFKSLGEYLSEWLVSTKTHYRGLVEQFTNSTAMVGTKIVIKIHHQSIPVLMLP